jgi:hypothetical protein
MNVMHMFGCIRCGYSASPSVVAYVMPTTSSLEMKFTDVWDGLRLDSLIFCDNVGEPVAFCLRCGKVGSSEVLLVMYQSHLNR